MGQRLSTRWRRGHYTGSICDDAQPVLDCPRARPEAGCHTVRISPPAPRGFRGARRGPRSRHSPCAAGTAAALCFALRRIQLLFKPALNDRTGPVDAPAADPGRRRQDPTGYPVFHGSLADSQQFLNVGFRQGSQSVHGGRLHLDSRGIANGGTVGICCMEHRGGSASVLQFAPRRLRFDADGCGALRRNSLNLFGNLGKSLKRGGLRSG